MTKQKNSISGWVTSKDENDVIVALENNKKLQHFDNNDMSSLVEVLGMWRIYLGVSKEPTAEEFVIIAQFVQQNYPMITLEEIRLAVNLSMLSQLDVDNKTYYDTFSVAYVTRILNAYLEYRKKVINDVLERKEITEQKLLLSVSSTPSITEMRQDMVDIIQMEYDHFKQHDEIKDSMGIVYKFLYRTKRLKIDQTDIDAALEYGRKHARASLDEQTKSIKELMEIDVEMMSKERKTKLENLTKQHARKFCVKKLFYSINISELVASIKEEEFSEKK